MNKAILTAAVATTVSQFACTIKRLTGYYGGAADAYLQLHAVDEVNAGDVPVLSLLLLTKDRFEYVPNIDMAACTVTVSSTEATYTANATGITGDIEYDQPPVTQGTVVGNYDDSLASLEVLESSGFVKRIVAINGIAGARYLQVFDQSTALTNGNVPLIEYPIASSSTRVLDFGNDGLLFRNSCNVAISSTSGSYTATAASHKFKAWIV